MDDFNMCKAVGISYKLRILFVTKIFDKYEKSGLSNREIHRKYIYPALGICEKTMYNMINNSCDKKYELTEEEKIYIKKNSCNIFSPVIKKLIK
nr:MAG TPA: hypothetical protein [Bacteriophage sp.]